VWIGADQGIDPADVAWLLALVTVAAGLLMVSNFRYLSFKQLNLHGRVPFMLAVGVMLAVALIVIHPPVILFLGFLLYAISGPVWTLVSLRQRRALRRERRPGQGGSGS
jgi:CDP-diacylglycerol--serine O-phosphatidyltransferase